MALLHVTFLSPCYEVQIKSIRTLQECGKTLSQNPTEQKKREGSHPCEPISPITLFHVKEIMFFVVFYFYYLRSV